MTDPDAVAQVENPVCGDVLKVSAKVKDGRISEIRFQAKGCVPAIACGSALTELAAGKLIDDLPAIGSSAIIHHLRGMPEATAHAAKLAADALSAIVKQLQSANRTRSNPSVPSGSS